MFGKVGLVIFIFVWVAAVVGLIYFGWRSSPIHEFRKRWKLKTTFWIPITYYSCRGTIRDSPVELTVVSRYRLPTKLEICVPFSGSIALDELEKQMKNSGWAGQFTSVGSQLCYWSNYPQDLEDMEAMVLKVIWLAKSEG